MKANPENLEYRFAEASLMVNAQRFEEALKVYDEIEKESGLVESVVMAKHQIYLQEEKKSRLLLKFND